MGSTRGKLSACSNYLWPLPPCMGSALRRSRRAMQTLFVARCSRLATPGVPYLERETCFSTYPAGWEYRPRMGSVHSQNSDYQGYSGYACTNQATSRYHILLDHQNKVEVMLYQFLGAALEMHILLPVPQALFLKTQLPCCEEACAVQSMQKAGWTGSRGRVLRVPPPLSPY